MITPLPEDPVGYLLTPFHPGDGAAGAVHPPGDIGLGQTTRPSPVSERGTELPFDVLDLPRIDHEVPDSPPHVEIAQCPAPGLMETSKPGRNTSDAR
ncbi:hypothetical protein ACFHWS_19785, partial [Micromonospora sp. LOL_013]|uniref:hypothetical protein n=1 Tax=Micromonospora sp. LOL_013 TaxID=3345414 RepID=UPI003A891C81